MKRNWPAKVAAMKKAEAEEKMMLSAVEGERISLVLEKETIVPSVNQQDQETAVEDENDLSKQTKTKKIMVVEVKSEPQTSKC
jgi:hypothetical protein